jgi:hypothetical protein
MTYEKPEVTVIGNAADLIRGSAKGNPPESSSATTLGVIHNAELGD